MNATRQSGIEIHDLKTRASLLYDAFFCAGISYLPSYYIRQLLMNDFFKMAYSMFWRKKCMKKFHLHRDVLVYTIPTLCFVLTLHISGLVCCPVSLSSSAAVEVFNALAIAAEFAVHCYLLLWYRISMLYKTSRFFGIRWHVVTKFFL